MIETPLRPRELRPLKVLYFEAAALMRQMATTFVGLPPPYQTHKLVKMPRRHFWPRGTDSAYNGSR